MFFSHPIFTLFENFVLNIFTMTSSHTAYLLCLLFKMQGVQFHPESIITSEGKMIVKNFIKLIERKEAESSN